MNDPTDQQRSEYAAWLARQRQPRQLVCTACGTAFIGYKRGERSYCSQRCRDATRSPRKRSQRSP